MTAVELDDLWKEEYAGRVNLLRLTEITDREGGETHLAMKKKRNYGPY